MATSTHRQQITGLNSLSSFSNLSNNAINLNSSNGAGKSSGPALVKGLAALATKFNTSNNVQQPQLSGKDNKPIKKTEDASKCLNENDKNKNVSQTELFKNKKPSPGVLPSNLTNKTNKPSTNTNLTSNVPKKTGLFNLSNGLAQKPGSVTNLASIKEKKLISSTTTTTNPASSSSSSSNLNKLSIQQSSSRNKIS